MVLERDIEDVAATHDELPNPDEVYDEDGEIAVDDVFDAEFIPEKTEFESFDELVAESPSEASSAADLEKVPHGEWDEFIAETTDFEGEKEFVMAARDHWVGKQLNLV